MVNDLDELISIYERRRRAPLHFLAKADNARFSAFLLWRLKDDDHRDHLVEAQYSGTSFIALNEAFRREAALALELIIKSLIAQQIECCVAKPGVIKVRPTHDLVTLWDDA